MKQRTAQFYEDFFRRQPQLECLRSAVEQAILLLTHTFTAGGKLLLCGNGGSCADCDHIAGELIKGFLLKRPVPAEFAETMQREFQAEGAAIAQQLQCGLPVISLCAHAAAISAYANDADAELVYAQQVLAYGRKGDVLLGISTSGNARNVAAAAQTARALGLTVVALTGKDGGRLAGLSSLALIAPEQETYRIQECHLALYHLLCGAVESELFER